ncbi:MAG: hypothetical protein WD625_06790 [Balneolales bacterium]
MARAYNRLPNIYADIEDVFGKIKQQVPVFEDSLVMLQHSMDRCESISAKEKYSLNELEKVEALKNRFIRVTDLILEVFLPLTDKMDGEKMGTIIDQFKRAEKKEIINKADDLIRIKNLSKDLYRSHFPDGLNEYLGPLIKQAPFLFEYFDGFIRYAKYRGFYIEPEKLSLPN